MTSKRSLQVVYVILLCIALSINMCYGFSKGAPVYSCKNLLPAHGRKPQSSPAPYSLTASRQVISPDEFVDVTLESTGDYPFRGFLCAASNLTDTKNFTVGEITLSSSTLNASNVQTIQCSRSTHNTGVTHIGKTDKYRVDFMWKPPPNGANRQFKLRCVAVLSYTQFWNSLILNITVRDSAKPSPIQPTVTDRPTFGRPTTPSRFFPTRPASIGDNNNDSGSSNTVLFPPTQSIPRGTNSNPVNGGIVILPPIPPTQSQTLPRIPNSQQRNLFGGSNPSAPFQSNPMGNSIPAGSVFEVQNNGFSNENNNGLLFPNNNNNAFVPIGNNNNNNNNNGMIFPTNNDVFIPNTNNNRGFVINNNNVFPNTNNNNNANAQGAFNNNNDVIFVDSNGFGRTSSNNNNDDTNLILAINNVPANLRLFDLLQTQPALDFNNAGSRGSIPPSSTNTRVSGNPRSRSSLRNRSRGSSDNLIRGNRNVPNENLIRSTERFFDVTEVPAPGRLLGFGFSSPFFLTPGALRRFQERNNIV